MLEPEHKASAVKKFAQFLGLFAILAGITIACAGSSSAQPSAFESFRNALVDYFGRLNYVPVLINRG